MRRTISILFVLYSRSDSTRFCQLSTDFDVKYESSNNGLNQMIITVKTQGNEKCCI